MLITGKGTAAVSWQTLADLLIAGGLDLLAYGAGTTQIGYLKNTDTAINLYVGTGTDPDPGSYITLIPTDTLVLQAGTNLNEVWLKPASSTVVFNWSEGAVYQSSSINGVIGDITATENQVPKADAGGDLVASSIADDGVTVTIDEDLEVTGASLFDDDITGAAGVAVIFSGSASGTTTVQASAAAGSTTLTLPAATDTLVGKATTDNLTNKTLVSGVISTGLTASGSAANTFASSTGTFITSTGANTLSGAVTVNDATTPSITTAAGKTNTGFLQINGKTSGSTKLITADATAQAVVISTAAQTVGGCTLTIPDQLGASSNFVFSNQVPTATISTPVTNITNVMANITDLTLSVKAAGVYIGQMVLNCNNSTAAEGIAIDFGGGNATATSFLVGAGVLTGGTTVAVTTVSAALATDFDWSTITGETWLTFQIMLTVNGTGTLIPRFRESTAHSTGTATITSGYLSLRMVA